MRAPKDKHESTDLFARGRYGNNIDTFASPVEALASNESAFVIRYKGEPGVQGPAIFGVKRNVLWNEWNALKTAGWHENRLYLNTVIPADRIVFQGELSTGNWADREWYLVGCEDAGIHMREAMKRSTFKATGREARFYLKSRMSPVSWDDFNLVIDEWPDGVIELVIFNTPYGSLAGKGCNCIIWEARAF